MPSPAPTSARSSQSARRILGALRRRVRRSGPLLTFPDVPGPIHPDEGALVRRFAGALVPGGIAIVTQYVCETFAARFDGALQLVSHQPRRWDDHQDVLAFVREA